MKWKKIEIWYFLLILRVIFSKCQCFILCEKWSNHIYIYSGSKKIEHSLEKVIDTIIGTDKNIPIMPHNQPQNIKLIRIARGLTFIISPIIRGSIMLPTTTWIIPRKIKTGNAGNKVPVLRKAIVTGKIVARMEPMEGIKFNKTVRIIHTRAKSTLKP